MKVDWSSLSVADLTADYLTVTLPDVIDERHQGKAAGNTLRVRRVPGAMAEMPPYLLGVPIPSGFSVIVADNRPDGVLFVVGVREHAGHE